MDLGSVDRITADAIGEPGMRTFYLQARAGEQLVTVIVEKEQVELLARSVLELATEVPIPDDVEPEELSLEEPVDPRWRVGRLSIGFDDEQDRFLLEIDEFVPEVDDEDDQRSVLPEEPESITLWASRCSLRHGVVRAANRLSSNCTFVVTISGASQFSLASLLRTVSCCGFRLLWCSTMAASAKCFKARRY